MNTFQSGSPVPNGFNGTPYGLQPQAGYTVDYPTHSDPEREQAYRDAERDSGFWPQGAGFQPAWAGAAGAAAEQAAQRQAYHEAQAQQAAQQRYQLQQAPYAQQQYLPQGAIANTLSQIGQPVGSAIGGAFGNAQLGGAIGSVAGQLGSMLPFQAPQAGIPRLRQSSAQPASAADVLAAAIQAAQEIVLQLQQLLQQLQAQPAAMAPQAAAGAAGRNDDQDVRDMHEAARRALNGPRRPSGAGNPFN